MTIRHKDRVMVSVVMSTHDQAALLEVVVVSILKQNSEKGFELIVVDDGSEDNTASILRRIQKERGERLRFVSQEKRGPAAARNRGIALARGEIVAFIDDDCEAAPDWLEKIMEGYEQDPKLAGIGGQTLPAEKGSIFNRYLDFRIMRQPHQEEDGTIIFPLTSNCSFRKAALDDVGGFDEEIPVPGGDDVDICMKLKQKGYLFSYQPEARVVHHHLVTARGFLRMCLNYGMGEVIRLRHFSPVYKIIRTIWWTRVLLAWLLIPFETYQFRKESHIAYPDAFMFACLHWVQRLISYIGGFRAWRYILRTSLEI
jgi:glycosyltransferase involved in cell wall biosynthesis